MSITTTNLMWIGNTSQFNTNSNTNITQGQANGIAGWTAEGRDEIKPIEVTGDSFNSGSRFHTSYQFNSSDMSYTDPDGDPQSGINITTFVSARFAITVHDENGDPSVVEQTGIIMQMSNGDMFFRPALDTVSDWVDITRISKVEVLSTTRLGLTTYPSTIGFDPEVFETEIVCFVRGTMIECADGLHPVENLKVGDLVRTLDNGLKPLRWIASQRLTSELTADPKLRPVRIRAGALGHGVPSADLVVSPQHRILVRSRIAARLFGATEVLVAAKQLLSIDGVEIADELEVVEYFHFAFDQHEIVLANGTETESLYPGPQALKTIGRAAREELFAIFPYLREQGKLPIAARQITTGRQARNLAARHVKNSRPLIVEMQH